MQIRLTHSHLVTYCGTAVLTLSLAACGGGGGAEPVAPVKQVDATELALRASSDQATEGGASVALTATLNGAGDVNWQLAPGSAGSLTAAHGTAVSYVPPGGGVYRAGQVTIIATAGNLSKTVVLALAPAPGLAPVAGSVGGGGQVDGSGTAARLNAILDMAQDTDGNVYVVDFALAGDVDQTHVRKISQAGVVSTIRKNSNGRSLALAPNGDLYFVNISLVDGHYPSPQLTRRRPDGTETVFSRDVGDIVRVDAGGTVYSSSGNAIYKYGADGSATVLAGQRAQSGFADGTGAAALFTSITDIALDKGGNLYVLDNGNVRKVTADAVVTTVLRGVAPGNVDGSPADAPLRGARSLAIGGDGQLLVLDRAAGAGGYMVRQFSGSTSKTLFEERDVAAHPEAGEANPGYDRLLRVAPDGHLLVGSATMLRRIETDGTRSIIAGMGDETAGVPIDGAGAAARYVHPGGLTADSEGNVYSLENFFPIDGADSVTTVDKLIVRKTTPAGQVSTLLNQAVGTPTGLAMTGDGQLYASVCYTSNSPRHLQGGAIYRVEAGNKVTLVAGATQPVSGQPVARDGMGAEARFTCPALAGADGAGNLYVRDHPASFGLSVVRRITPQAVVSTVDGLPSGFGVAPDGREYGVNTDWSYIYRKEADGYETVVAGKKGSPGHVFGALPGGLDHPTSIVATGPGTFAVASGSAILRLVLPKLK